GVNGGQLVADQPSIDPAGVGIGDGREQRLRQRAEARRRNFILWKGLAGGGVVDGDEIARRIDEVGKVSLLHGRRGDRADAIERLILAEPVGADMEKGAVATV